MIGSRLFFALIVMWPLACGADDRVKPDYAFDGAISRQVLENYLARAITMNGMSYSPCFEDDLRMVDSLDAKLLSFVAYLWGQPPADEEAYWRHVKSVAERIHRSDPDRILQAGVFEAIYDGIDRLTIPAWVFEACGEPVEARNFSYAAMLFDNGFGRNHWGPGASIPDITKPETRRWFYYRAAQYIDSGYEAIEFGQIALTAAGDPELRHLGELLKRVRRYAATKARRHYVLMNTQTDVTARPLVYEGKLLFDFLNFPLRPKEVPGQPEKAILELGHADTIIGRSPGGVHPSGWHCEHLPYLVNFDQCLASGREGQPNTGLPWVWGYEEAAWLAHQPAEYRNEWLAYAHDWVRRTDPNGHLTMPGSLPLAVKVHDDRWYRANTPSTACPTGGGQETTIKAIWNKP